jgi:VanZ family protein
MNKGSTLKIYIFLIIITCFTIAALIPRKMINFAPYGGDDLAHIYIFLVLSSLLCFSNVMHKKYIYLILFSYGLIIEVLQFLVGRSFSYLDISFNFIGVGLGIIFYFFLNKVINYYK